MNLPNRHGMMIIISSPSGAGKSTICKMLLKNESSLQISVSVTTRERRQSEIEGQDYFFISKDDFLEMKNNNQLLEYAEIYGNSYGSPSKIIFDQLNQGVDILFDIDWQGARQIYQNCSKYNIISIFILPPSINELYNRLQKRAEDSKEVIQKRLQNAKTEIQHFNEYDYVIINSKVEDTFKQIEQIINTERLKRHRNPYLIQFIEGMISDKASC
ncbi:guanylate kinase [Rickettsiales endosymbiont of Stachyamoeba lipophora]|uniref:guanylate kinase n=1 Tax=Rickettsiales endosymbiont of Stachyamoeba lipophora TaxID=2486578 RepID=UPI000F64B626|nr:guanylate kinase [Rickettsiales endosymbiont of Stachyamoeba lipophora]AZL15733.1 guanylate kinase [Rickettsiales endosymbiont of Stachyamoeba lipophora]